MQWNYSPVRSQNSYCKMKTLREHQLMLSLSSGISLEPFVVYKDLRASGFLWLEKKTLIDNDFIKCSLPLASLQERYY